MTRCIGLTAKGDLCKGVAARGSDWCPAHDPARKDARRRNASRAARSKPGREMKDLKAQLETLAEDVLAGDTEPKVGAVVNQLLTTRTRLLETERKIRETEDLAARVEELDLLLKDRDQGEKEGRYGA